MATVAELLHRTFRRAPPNLDVLRLQYQREKEVEQARRVETAESRRESERRWYARLPIIAIATLATSVVAITALLAVASLYTQPSTKEVPAATDSPPKKEAAPPPSAPASAPNPVSIQMNLSSKELFGYNRSDLRVVSGSAQRELDACLEPKLTRVHVIGHADCIGSDEFNQGLSERRALAVKSYLTKKGVDATLITTEGRGAAMAKTEALCAGVVRKTAANVARLEPFRRVDVACEYARQVQV